MFNIYQWLYDHYALPQLETLESGQEDILKQISAHLTLSEQERFRLLNTMENLRLQWGTETFSLGIRFGLELAAHFRHHRTCNLRCYPPAEEALDLRLYRQRDWFPCDNILRFKVFRICRFAWPSDCGECH